MTPRDKKKEQEYFDAGLKTGLALRPLNKALASQIFEELDKIIVSGYPYKRFHPRKYNMLKKKYA